MPLTTLPELRKAAAAVHGAIAAFQTGFVEIMQAVYREGQAAQTPVIVETTDVYKRQGKRSIIGK